MKNYQLVSIALSVSLLLSCTDTKIEGQEAADAKGKIGVSILSSTNPFFVEIGDVITSEATKHGYQVQVVSSDFDPNRQYNQVQDFIVNGYDAIVLTPADSRAVGSAVKEANEAGIPVFTADIAVLAEGVDVVSHIATDNYQAGRMAAQAMIEATGGNGSLGIIDHPAIESVILRTKGFQDELNETEGHDLKVVSILPGGGVKDQGFKAMQDMLQSHPEIDGIFAINDPSALGAVAALEDAGKLENVKVVSVDGQQEGIDAIDQGKIYADAVQHPDWIGEKTVGAIVAYMNGEKVESEILIPTDLYKKDKSKQ